MKANYRSLDVNYAVIIAYFLRYSLYMYMLHSPRIDINNQASRQVWCWYEPAGSV